MDRERVDEAIGLLGRQFPLYDWTYKDVPGTGGAEVRFEWYGGADEDVMVCAHVGRELSERFHRHGFFFFNYAYKGAYRALSHSRDNLVTVEQDEMYVGQPFSGYALRGNREEDIVILGVLVRVETFWREFLPQVAADSELLDFWLGPREDRFSDEYRQLKMPLDSGARDIFELMAQEYAFRRGQAQPVLKALALALAELAAREWRRGRPYERDGSLGERVGEAISSDLAHASLGKLARELGYHPNYLSGLIRERTGKTFSQLVLEQRMARAQALLERTALSVEDVAEASGYSSTSNFYKAYRSYYGRSPRAGALRADSPRAGSQRPEFPQPGSPQPGARGKAAR